MKVPSDSSERVASDFARLQLGDPRRSRRVQQTAAKLARAPSVSLPVALGTSAELEGAYRLMNNRHVTFDKLIGAHADATRERAEAAREVLVLHDTTTCSFPHVRPEEIGYLTTGKPGFPLHLALVVDAAEWRRPLGVIHAEALFRPKRSSAKGRTRKAARQADYEFGRWWRAMQASGQALRNCQRVIHVADREGDSYELMAELLAAGQRFVIRARVDRRSCQATEAGPQQWSTIKQVMRGCGGMLQREVPLSHRNQHTLANQSKAHPARKARLAHLRFAATEVSIPRPHRLDHSLPDVLKLNLVHVSEPEAPMGEAPIEWLLYTTEPIDTAVQVAQLVDIYRTRWMIEEFNAALKTGCAYEARQFESRDALLNLLAISLPVACEMLWLRSRARCNPKASASEVLSPLQLQILCALLGSQVPPNPNLGDALLAVARLGGHLKANGPPGWKVLQRGMTRLLDYQPVWLAAQRAPPLTDDDL